ncbi:5362_t:CDS:2, partial [Rhizophagus irregularis]
GRHTIVMKYRHMHDCDCLHDCDDGNETHIPTAKVWGDWAWLHLARQRRMAHATTPVVDAPHLSPSAQLAGKAQHLGLCHNH